MRRVVTAALAAAAVLGPAAAVLGPAAAPAAASAGADGGIGPGSYRPEPWRAWVQEEWTAPAGRYCSFPLQVRVVSQDVRVRVVARYGDGAVRREEFAGPLVVDFVNGATGQSVRRDAGGSGAADYRPDGSWRRYTIVGPAGFGFRPEDRHPRGYYLLDGVHVIAFDADGTRRMAVEVGREENVCRSLGDAS